MSQKKSNENNGFAADGIHVKVGLNVNKLIDTVVEKAYEKGDDSAGKQERDFQSTAQQWKGFITVEVPQAKQQESKESKN